MNIHQLIQLAKHSPKEASDIFSTCKPEDIVHDLLKMKNYGPILKELAQSLPYDALIMALLCTFHAPNNKLVEIIFDIAYEENSLSNDHYCVDKFNINRPIKEGIFVGATLFSLAVMTDLKLAKNMLAAWLEKREVINLSAEVFIGVNSPISLPTSYDEEKDTEKTTSVSTLLLEGKYKNEDVKQELIELTNSMLYLEKQSNIFENQNSAKNGDVCFLNSWLDQQPIINTEVMAAIRLLLTIALEAKQTEVLIALLTHEKLVGNQSDHISLLLYVFNGAIISKNISCFLTVLERAPNLLAERDTFDLLYFESIKNNCMPVAKFLLDNIQLDVEYRRTVVNFALFYALRENATDFAKYLFQLIDIDFDMSINMSNETIVDFVIRRNQLWAVVEICSHPNFRDDHVEKIVRYFRNQDLKRNEFADLVNMMIKRKSSISDHPELMHILWFRATAHGLANITGRFIEEKLINNVNNEMSGNSALTLARHCAKTSDRTAVIYQLTKSGELKIPSLDLPGHNIFSPEELPPAALILLARHKNLRVFYNNEFNNALHQLARKDGEITLSYAMKRCIDTPSSYKNMTLLHFSAYFGRQIAFQQLHNAGADIYIIAQGVGSALECAIKSGQIEIAAELLANIQADEDKLESKIRSNNPPPIEQEYYNQLSIEQLKSHIIIAIENSNTAWIKSCFLTLNDEMKLEIFNFIVRAFIRGDINLIVIYWFLYYMHIAAYSDKDITHILSQVTEVFMNEFHEKLFVGSIHAFDRNNRQALSTTSSLMDRTRILHALILKKLFSGLLLDRTFCLDYIINIYSDFFSRWHNVIDNSPIDFYFPIRQLVNHMKKDATELQMQLFSDDEGIFSRLPAVLKEKILGYTYGDYILPKNRLLIEEYEVKSCFLDADEDDDTSAATNYADKTKEEADTEEEDTQQNTWDMPA